MSDEVMICLVGEQPLANLLPARYDQPAHIVLAYTSGTRQVSARLEKVLGKKALVYPLEVSAFNIPQVRQKLEAFVSGRGWQPGQLVFNLTGGTKAMGFAAYSLAETWQSRLVYMESEESNRLYRYEFNRDGTLFLQQEDALGTVINLEDYLKAHLDSYGHKDFGTDSGAMFERAVFEVLKPPVLQEVDHGVQLMGALDLDLVFRCGNRVGIAEVKTGNAAWKKGGLDQLNTAGRREYLGTYVCKFLIVDRTWDDSRSNLRELAGISDIKVIELPSYGQASVLSDTDKERMIREITETLGC